MIVGLTASRYPAAVIALALASVGLYALAQTRGWLARTEGRVTRTDALVTTAFAAFAAAFVLLTGGADSPFPCTLYLPVLLASLCFGLRLGLATSVVMLGVCAAVMTQGHLPPTGLTLRHVAVGFSFPLTAVFARLLNQQLEARYFSLHSQAEDLTALLNMSQMMDSAADLDTTLNLVLLNVQKLTGCPICAIYLKSSAGERLELRAASGLRERVALLPSLPLAHARCGDWHLLPGPDAQEQSDRACYIPDVSVHAAAPKTGLFRLDPRALSFACVPLASMEGLLGLLYVGYDAPNGLRADDVLRLENLANRAAFSLQRVIIQQDYQSKAYSDAMTGLDNFRRFEQDLTSEMQRAERYGRPLSLILLDIDHFKSFNDTLGHQAGDALLGQLAAVLRDSLRSVDKPARYGGEEFVVVCPETGAPEARLIAERIRRAVEQTPFALVDKERSEDGSAPRTTRVTVSVGFATFPRDARTPRDLIREADKALYAAKAAGRNTVRGQEDLSLRQAVA